MGILVEYEATQAAKLPPQRKEVVDLSESRTAHARRVSKIPRDQSKTKNTKKNKAKKDEGLEVAGAPGKRQKGVRAESTIRKDSNCTSWSFLHYTSPTKGPGSAEI